jgi:hypothetical protein
MNSQYVDCFEQEGLMLSRIFGSKSTYRNNHPDHLIVFNARIYTKETYTQHADGDIKDFFAGQEHEIWWGDIDFDKDTEALTKVAKAMGKSIVITTEHGTYVRTIE